MIKPFWTSSKPGDNLVIRFSRIICNASKMKELPPIGNKRKMGFIIALSLGLSFAAVICHACYNLRNNANHWPIQMEWFSSLALIVLLNQMRTNLAMSARNPKALFRFHGKLLFRQHPGKYLRLEIPARRKLLPEYSRSFQNCELQFSWSSLKLLK